MSRTACCTTAGQTTRLQSTLRPVCECIRSLAKALIQKCLGGSEQYSLLCFYFYFSPHGQHNLCIAVGGCSATRWNHKRSTNEHKSSLAGCFLCCCFFKKSKRAVFFMTFWTYTLLLNVTNKDIKDKKCSRAAWWQQDLLNQTSDSSFHQSRARLVRHRLTLILSLGSRIHRKVDYTLCTGR